MSIQFTQFMYPDGHRKTIEIDRDVTIEDKAKQLVEQGCSLEAEVLSTGEVHLAVEHHEREETIAMEVGPNGPTIPEMVDRLITNAYERMTI